MFGDDILPFDLFPAPCPPLPSGVWWLGGVAKTRPPVDKPRPFPVPPVNPPSSRSPSSCGAGRSSGLWCCNQTSCCTLSDQKGFTGGSDLARSMAQLKPLVWAHNPRKAKGTLTHLFSARTRNASILGIHGIHITSQTPPPPLWRIAWT